MAAVNVEDLRKTYGKVEALGGVSFSVEPGEVFALLGPNGAGKTTAVEILEGFRRRDAGRVEVLGFDPSVRRTQRDFRERIGIVLQELAVEPYLTVAEVLSRNAGFYPNPRPVGQVLELVGMSEHARVPVKKLSGGQQRRLDMGLGIIGNPQLLFLDEPTTGFDPSARRGAWETVTNLASGGTTVILTTHYMDEAEALADRVAVVAHGAIVASGTPETIGGRDVSEARIRFRLPDAHDAADLPVTPTRIEDHHVEIRTREENEVLYRLLDWARRKDLELTGLTVERLTLEDVYLQLTGYQAEPTGGVQNAPLSGGK